MKKEEAKYVKIDSRNRVTIPKQLSGEMAKLYRIYEQDGNIILEPVREVPKEEQWLFDPKNKAIVDDLKETLKQKADRKIDLDMLEQE